MKKQGSMMFSCLCPRPIVRLSLSLSFLSFASSPHLSSLSFYHPPPTTHSYVTELKVEDDSVVFFLPTAVAPRYNPSSERDPLVFGAGGLAQGRRGLSITARMHMGTASSTSWASAPRPWPSSRARAATTKPRCRPRQHTRRRSRRCVLD